MKRNIKVSYAARLRKLRKEYGYTQQKLAELSDIEYKHVQRLESKKPCDVKLTTLEKIAKAFNITISKLLDMD